MLWHLAAATVYLLHASAAADASGKIVVNVLKPRLTDPGSDQGTCCEGEDSSKVLIYQAVLHETVKFQVYTKVVESAVSTADNDMSVVVRPVPKTGCSNSFDCWSNDCSYTCEPANKVSLNGSECYVLVATSRTPSDVIDFPICVYNRSAEPLNVLNHSAARDFDKSSVTLNYTVGGYPLPASITATCYEHADGRRTHQVNASVSFVQYNVGHYIFQLNDVTADEIQCRVAAHGEFYHLTSETELINVTSARKIGFAFTFGTATEQFVSHEVTAVATNPDTSRVMHSESTTPSGISKVVVVWLSTAAVVSILIAMVVGVVMWRRSATRKLVTHIRNENHLTTIVNNDNRQTIVNNCQHNYFDAASHSGVIDIKELLIACDDNSTTSNIDRSMHGLFHKCHEDCGCINGDNIEGVS